MWNKKSTIQVHFKFFLVFYWTVKQIYNHIKKENIILLFKILIAYTIKVKKGVFAIRYDWAKITHS